MEANNPSSHVPSIFYLVFLILSAMRSLPWVLILCIHSTCRPCHPTCEIMTRVVHAGHGRTRADVPPPKRHYLQCSYFLFRYFIAVISEFMPRVLRSPRPSRHCSFFKPSDGPPTTYGSCCILLVIHKQRGKFLGKLGKFFSRPATPTEIRSESHPKQSCCPICLAYIGLHSEHGHLVPTQAIHIIYSPPFGFSTQINNGVYEGEANSQGNNFRAQSK